MRIWVKAGRGSPLGFRKEEVEWVRFDPPHTSPSLRRRLGRANLGRNLQDQPASAALAANLQHPEVVRVVSRSLDNLATTFAVLDEQTLERTTPLSRRNRDRGTKMDQNSFI